MAQFRQLDHEGSGHRRGTFMVTLTILLAFFVQMFDQVIQPALELIYSAFPDASPLMFNLFLTGPMFFAIVGALGAGFLARYVSKKTLLIISYVLFAASAATTALIDNFAYMAAMRQVSGLAMGLGGTLLMGLIAELFVEEKQRSRVMGLTNTASAAIGIVTALVGGYLATLDWHYPFAVYWASVPILLLIIVFVPKTPPEGKAAPEKTIDGAALATEKLPWAKFLPLCVAFTVSGILYFIVIYYLAFYVFEFELGDESLVGIISAVGTAAGVVAGILFSPVYMKIKRVIVPICFFMLAACYVVMGLVPNVWVGAVMFFIGSGGYIMLNSYYFMRTSMIVPVGVMTLAMSILTVAMNLSAFLCSFVTDGYKALVGSPEMVTPIFPWVGLTAAICGAIAIVLAIRARREPEPEFPDEPLA